MPPLWYRTKLAYLGHTLLTAAFFFVGILNHACGINEIKIRRNSMLREGNSKGLNKKLNRIIKEIDQHITTEKDWEQFQTHFDQVHGDFSKPLKAAYPKLSPPGNSLLTCA